MRDFRDAKAMAQTLRESLTTNAVTITHSESLELVSKMLGAADWNTCSPSAVHTCTIKSSFSSSADSSPEAPGAFIDKPERNDKAVCCMW